MIVKVYSTLLTSLLNEVDIHKIMFIYRSCKFVLGIKIDISKYWLNFFCFSIHLWEIPFLSETKYGGCGEKDQNNYGYL